MIEPVFVHWEAKMPGEQSPAGGFWRCDTPEEQADFEANCDELGLAHWVPAPRS